MSKTVTLGYDPGQPGGDYCVTTALNSAFFTETFRTKLRTPPPHQPWWPGDKFTLRAWLRYCWDALRTTLAGGSVRGRFFRSARYPVHFDRIIMPIIRADGPQGDIRDCIMQLPMTTSSAWTIGSPKSVIINKDLT